MEFLAAIKNEPLTKIQEIMLKKGVPFGSKRLDYDALNAALVYKRKDVAKWLIELSCRVNKVSGDDKNLYFSTPIHNAVKLDDIEIVGMLLKKEASIVAVDADDNSALHVSFLYRYDKITDLLLNHIVEKSNYTNVKNSQGLSHLHIASARNNIKAIEGFIKDEADLEDTVKVDSSSSWAGYTALHLAMEFKSLEAAKFLLDAGRNMKNGINSGKSTSELLQQYRDEILIMSGHLDKKPISYFHLACLRESVRTVKKFIDRGADVNEAFQWDASLCDHYLPLPLQCAIKSPYDRQKKVQLLLNHGAIVGTALHLAFYGEHHMSELDTTIVDCLFNVVKDGKENILDKNGLSYFHIAVTRNEFDTVKKYIEKGANINQAILQNDRGFSGYTALHFAVHYQLVDMAKFLIECGADVNAGEDGKLLSTAFHTKNISMTELLFKCGARLCKSAHDSSDTLLHAAAEAGSHEIVQYLVDSGDYDVNAKNDLGKTPLLKILKADFPCRKVIEILLKASANIFVKDIFDDSVWKIVNSSVWLHKETTRFEIYKIFLENASIHLVHYDLLRFGNAKDIKMLLETGIDLSKVDPAGATVVHMLATNFSSNVIEQIRGLSFDINVRDKTGWTPLMYAAFSGNSRAVEFLLKAGADIEISDTFKRTALYLAVESIGYNDQAKKCIQVLLEHGANAQISVVTNDPEEPIECPTVFDIILRENSHTRSQPILAHLAFQETNGTTITRVIHSKIDSDDRFKRYFETCKQQLSVTIYQSVTLFDLLAASDRKLERYLRNEKLAAKLIVFQTAVDYFNTILNKRVSKAAEMVDLRKTAVPVICKFLKTDYNRFPGIADDIVSYLDKQDLEHLTFFKEDSS